jgi:hypothetical protein
VGPGSAAIRTGRQVGKLGRSEPVRRLGKRWSRMTQEMFLLVSSGTTNHTQTAHLSWTTSAGMTITQKSNRTHFGCHKPQSDVECKLVIRIPMVLPPPMTRHPPRCVAHKHRFVHIDFEAALGVE